MVRCNASAVESKHFDCHRPLFAVGSASADLVSVLPSRAFVGDPKGMGSDRNYRSRLLSRPSSTYRREYRDGRRGHHLDRFVLSVQVPDAASLLARTSWLHLLLLGLQSRSNGLVVDLARISHQDHGSRRRIRIRKRRSGAKSVAIATV